LPSSLTKLTKLKRFNLNNNKNLWYLNHNFEADPTYSSSNPNFWTNKVVDTNWNWKPDKNMTIKWYWLKHIVITIWNQKWFFTDFNFVKCLKNWGGAYDSNWNNVQLTFYFNFNWT